MKKMMSWMGGAMILMWVAGCATSGFQKAERGSSSMADIQGEVQNAREQVSRTVGSLDTLMGAQVGDLRPLFADFNSQVKRLESDRDTARARAITMQTENKAYFASWAQEIAAISDPAIKAQSQQRLKETYSSYQQVEQMMFKLRDAYLPLISGLNDMNVAMNQDLTPSGLAGLKPSYGKVRQQAITLQGVMKNALSTIQAAMKQMTPRASGIVM